MHKAIACCVKLGTIRSPRTETIWVGQGAEVERKQGERWKVEEEVRKKKKKRTCVSPNEKEVQDERLGSSGRKLGRVVVEDLTCPRECS